MKDMCACGSKTTISHAIDVQSNHQGSSPTQQRRRCGLTGQELDLFQQELTNGTFHRSITGRLWRSGNVLALQITNEDRLVRDLRRNGRLERNEYGRQQEEAHKRHDRDRKTTRTIDSIAHPSIVSTRPNFLQAKSDCMFN